MAALRPCTMIPRPLKIMIARNLRPMGNVKFYSSSKKALESDQDIDDFLSNPTWSVKSLLPTEEQIENSKDVSPKQLHHLLRLSALPPPESSAEEAKMLRDLRSQLHFVKEIQKVNTEGVEPLRSVRDETVAAEKEREASLESLKDAMKDEIVIGKHYKRIRRQPSSQIPKTDVEDWDVLGQAPQKVGKYFVVHSDNK